MAPDDAVVSGGNPEVDRTLMREVASGSADALSRLYDRHAASVYGLARRMLTRLEDAEEVVQDVFTQVWRQAARYQSDRATVSGWILMLARTRAIDRLRARRARPDADRGAEPLPERSTSSSDRSPEDAALSAADGRRVGRALATLPETLRSLIELAYFEGLTHTEIAARTGIPLGTVKTRLRTAMETLRQALPS